MLGENTVYSLRTRMDNNHKLHHYMGIELNQQTWALLEKSDRNERDDQRMVAFAKASLYHWQHSPNFQPVNEQRGYWLISRVYAVLGKGDKALSYAETCWAITEKHDLKDFDLAYAYEALARSYAALGQSENMNKYFTLAKEAGNQIANSEDQSYFMSDLLSDPWFECTKPMND